MTALITLLGAIGCSNGAMTDTQPNEQQVVLRVVNYAGLSVEALTSANQEFRKQNPGVDVQVLEGSERPLSAGGSGESAFDGIDVVLVNHEVMWGLAEAGLLKEIPLLKMPTLDPFLLGVYDDLATQGGKRFGTPLTVVPMMVGVNEALLKKAAVNPPAATWTWTDFDQAAAGVKSTGMDVALDGRQLLDPIIRSYGGQLYDVGRQAWWFDKPEAEQALSFMARLAKLGAISLDGRNGGPPGRTAFRLVTARSGLGQGEIVLPLPVGPQGRSSPVSAVVAAVPTATTQSDLALQYVREMLNNPAIQATLARAGIRPVVEDAGVTSAWREVVGNPTAEAWEIALQDVFVPVRSAVAADVVTGLSPFFQGTSPFQSTVLDLIPRLKAPNP